MARKYFGTDGVRGRANTGPLTPMGVVQIASAVGQYFSREDRKHRVVIGKDTRRSCYMIENALTAGLSATGMDVIVLGPMPTPAVGLLTNSMRADLGVMISASHNPYYDNGIKFFGPDGHKLSDTVEQEIESLIDGAPVLADAQHIGRVTRVEEAAGRYVEFAKTTLQDRVRFHGLKVVIDCANGAAYKAAPQILWELGAEVIPIGVAPNGYNINAGCGSTAPELAVKTVRETGADVAICLDGDADRITIVDETGTVADGDQIMALLATEWAREGRLAQNTLVATVMSNFGLERYLADQGIALRRTDVGDRYVVSEMRKRGFNMGGEQSGHIVMSDYGTTGDGLVAGLQFLSILKQSGKPASELLRQFTPVPQEMINVRYTLGTAPLEAEKVKAAMETAEARLGSEGRLLVRKSGTEPVIRVMGESEDSALLAEVLGSVAAEIEAVSKG